MQGVPTQIPPHEGTRADRQAVQRRTPVPVRFEFRFVPLLLWRVLERRGAAEPLVYSSTRQSAIKSFIRYFACFLGVKSV